MPICTANDYIRSDKIDVESVIFFFLGAVICVLFSKFPQIFLYNIDWSIVLFYTCYAIWMHANQRSPKKLRVCEQRVSVWHQIKLNDPCSLSGTLV